ncbi:hypothetical protein [Shewanella sp. Scap07]|nr:hypothetical protein [Shewanella sp. Scap07]
MQAELCLMTVSYLGLSAVTLLACHQLFTAGTDYLFDFSNLGDSLITA